MKKLLTTFLLATLVTLCCSAGIMDKAILYGGSASWNAKPLTNNMVATSKIANLYLAFPQGTSVSCVANTATKITSDAGYSYDGTAGYTASTGFESGPAVNGPSVSIPLVANSIMANGLKEGWYTAILPAGALTVDGETNAEELKVRFLIDTDTNTYTATDAITYAFTPEAGTTPSISEIKVKATLPELYEVVNGGISPAKSVTLTPAGGQPVTCSVSIDESTVTYTIKTPAGFTAQEGMTYTLNIPEGTMRFRDKDSYSRFTNEEINVSYTIGEGGSVNPPVEYQKIDFGFTANPDPANTITKLTEVILSMSGTGYNMIGIAEGAYATLTPAAGQPVVCTLTDAGDFTFKVTVPAMTFADNTQYTLTIPEGSINLESADGQTLYTNNAASFVYTTGSKSASDIPGLITWCEGTSWAYVKPITGPVTSLYCIQGKFNNGETIIVEEGHTVTVTGPDGYTYTSNLEQPLEQVYENGQMVFVPAAGVKFYCANYYSHAEAEGEYTATIPGGAFTVDGIANEQFTVTFTVADTRTYEVIDLGLSANPDPSVDADDLTDILLTMNNKDAAGKKLYLDLGVTPGLDVTLTTPDGNSVVCPFDGVAASSGSLAFQVKIPVGVDFSVRGRYTVTIPEGIIRLQSNSGSKYYKNTAVQLVYNLSGNGTSSNIADKIVWSTGSSFSTRKNLGEDRLVQSLGRFYGMLEGCKVTISGRPEVTITGPEDYSHTSELMLARALDPISGEIADQPCFQFNASNKTYDITVPGEYFFHIPANSFQVDGLYNEAIDYSVIVKDMRTYETFPGELEVFPIEIALGTSLEKLDHFRLRFKVTDANGKRIYSGTDVQPHSYGTITDKATGEVITLDFKTDAGVFGVEYNAFKLVFYGDYAIQKNATFTVRIPAGQMIIRGEGTGKWYTNEELVYNVIIGNGGTTTPDKEYSPTKPLVTPAEGEVQALAGIQFETPDFENFYMQLAPQGNTPVKFTVTRPDGSKDEYEPVSSPNYAFMDLKFNEIYTTPGTYTISVPRGSYKYVNTSTGKELYTSGFELTYTVKNSGEFTDVDYTLSTSENGDIDKNGAAVYYFSTIFLKTVEKTTPTDYVYATVVYPDNSVHYARASYSAANERFMISCGYPQQIGTYEITFPAGAVMTADGKLNKDIKFKMTLLDTETKDIEFTSTPENGSTVTELKEIEIMAPEGCKEVQRYLSGITKSYFYNDDDRENQQMNYIQTGSTPTSLKVTLKETVTEVGDYTLEIPAGSITCIMDDDSQVMASALAFCWSIRTPGSVAGIGEEADTLYNVYDLNGVQIIRDGSADDLNRLAKGIYIINGRTYIIR